MTVEGKKVRILAEFPVLWAGWECDSKGWVVTEKKSTDAKVVLTDHGSPYFADREELQDKLNEYREVVTKTESALALLNSTK